MEIFTRFHMKSSKNNGQEFWYLLPREKNLQFEMKKYQLSARFWRLIKPNRGILLQSLIGAFVFSVLGLSMSIYVGKLVDNVLPGGNLIF